MRDVDAGVFAELGDQPVHQHVIDVVTTEVGVAVGRDHLHDVVTDLEDRDVEGAAAEVVDGDDLVGFLVEAVGERRRGRLVDDALHVETGDLAGVLGGLALRVVEVRGHGDHGFGDLLAQVVFGRLLQLLQDLGRDLRRGHLLAAGFDPGVAVRTLDELERDALGLLLTLFEAAADEALGRVDRVFRVGHGLTLGDRTDQDLALVVPSDDGGREARSLFVDDDFGFLAFHDGHDAVGRAEVDADDLTHECWFSSRRPSTLARDTFMRCRALQPPLDRAGSAKSSRGGGASEQIEAPRGREREQHNHRPRGVNGAFKPEPIKKRAPKLSPKPRAARCFLVDTYGAKATFRVPVGAVAQLGERCVRNAEVRGSIPLRSTLQALWYSRDALRKRGAPTPAPTASVSHWH